ncbi:MAG: radical SAM protein [Bdellovibrionales bacterium]|nr:radical SAM protein [Bdellovibrionales bacterium]
MTKCQSTPIQSLMRHFLSCPFPRHFLILFFSMALSDKASADQKQKQNNCRQVIQATSGLSGHEDLVTWMNFVQRHPHEFTIQYPPRREYFQENFRNADQTNVSPDRKSPWLLYIHVPFCSSRCFFCNFAIDVRNHQSIYESYVNAVQSELRNLEIQIGPDGVPGIDIGGGTPTRLPIEYLEKLLIAIKPFQLSSQHPFGTSIETTPSIAGKEPEKMALLSSQGVRRVSMGIQSFNDKHLSDVNRYAQIDMGMLAAINIHDLPFERFNVDLIFGLPNQSEHDWEEDLRQVVKLNPDSITTYDCLYRGKGRALTKKTPCLPSLDDYGRLYDIGYNFLARHGYFAPYGSVNFSRIPEETGTSAYFEGRLLDGLPYVGVGNYASSWLGDTWYFNVKKVDQYIALAKGNQSLVGDSYVLPSLELYARYILFSLNYGIIDEKKFYKRFGVEFSKIFERELEYAIEKKWLVKRAGFLWTIPYGQFRNINYIRSLFYSRQARDWLMRLHGHGS